MANRGSTDAELAAPPHNLPAPVTSFIGRTHEIAEVERLLRTTRLLTLTGEGGIGKTRLAFQIAARGLETYRDGVWLVELATVSSPGAVRQVLAAVLRTREEPGRPLLETLAQAIGARQQLLLLDTCEHLIGACAVLSEHLLKACPRLSILATSREPLGIAGELAWRVPPLPTPDPQRVPPLDQLPNYASVQLFLDRAGAAQPAFRLTESAALALARICEQLDGNPLAIELAAARVKVLTVEQIAERLEDRFRLLTGGSRTAAPRQQSLRGAIEWSYDLLDQQERALFNRLSVFAGGCTLGAVAAVCGVGAQRLAETLDILSRLVDKSLVVADDQRDAKRFRLLETLRAYARERLVTSGEAERLQRRHAEYFRALAEQAEPELWGPDLVAWLERLETEHENLRAAMGWAVGRGEAEIGLRLGAALRRFWQVRGHFGEGLRWLESGLVWQTGVSSKTRARALDAVGHLARDRGEFGRASDAYRQSLELRRVLGDRRGAALALNSLGVVAQFQGEYQHAVKLQEESLALFRELRDDRGVAISLITLGVVAQLQGDRAQATARFEESLALFEALGDRHGVAAVQNNLGNLASQHGDYVAAERHYEQSAALFHQLGDLSEVAACLGNLSAVARDSGNPARATRLAREALVAYRELGDRRGIAVCLDLLASLASTKHQLERAALLSGAADRLRRSVGTLPRPASTSVQQAGLAATGQIPETQRLSAAREIGRTMPLEEVIALALADGIAVAPGAPHTRSATEERVSLPLTRRECEVAALVARGKTNRQIAADLVITELTAETHVRNILRKLNLTSRAQVAAWAVEHRLPAGS